MFHCSSSSACSILARSKGLRFVRRELSFAEPGTGCPGLFFIACSFAANKEKYHGNNLLSILFSRFSLEKFSPRLNLRKKALTGTVFRGNLGLGMIHALDWFWVTYFYAPVYNALIWLYNGPAEQNLGLSVIFLTLGLRLLIFPLTVISERNKHVYSKVEEQVAEIERTYKNDPEQQKERVRELLKEHHVSPWSKSLALALQALVFILLYQVFMGGIRMNRFDVLYSWVDKPDIVFTNFLGTDLGKRSLIWAGIVGIWLYLEIAADQKKHKETITKPDLFYRIAFPAFSFGALFILPSVKSIFILTSMAFSFIIASSRKVLFKEKD
jgi:YidC/Oxa1 family membrane protein insertase